MSIVITIIYALLFLIVVLAIVTPTLLVAKGLRKRGYELGHDKKLEPGESSDAEITMRALSGERAFDEEPPEPPRKPPLARPTAPAPS